METSPVVRPVDLGTDYHRCRSFHEDTYLCSFGTTEGFYETFGPDGRGYLPYLEALLEAEPGSVAHLLQDGKILGQVELGAHPADPTVGYVFIYYLVPEARGKGYSRHLEAYAMAYFRRRGFLIARLSVTTDNLPAIRSYEQHGWQRAGFRPDKPGVLLMETIVRLEP